MLPAELKELAKHLIDVSPKEGFLRRAISTAYYAVFHLLIEEAGNRFMPADPPGLRLQAMRAFAHRDMKNMCMGFAGQAKQSEKLAQMLALPVEAEIRKVAEIFVELYEARHAADYDRSARIDRPNVMKVTARMEEAFTAWEAVRTGQNAGVFLAALMLDKAWKSN